MTHALWYAMDYATGTGSLGLRWNSFVGEFYICQIVFGRVGSL